LSKKIWDWFADAVPNEAEEEHELESVHTELEDKLKQIEEHVKGLETIKAQVGRYTEDLDRVKDRGGEEYAVKLKKIEVFRNELVVVDDLEKRLKDATEKIEEQKLRLEKVREGIEEEKKKQAERERRTDTQRSILWTCIGIGVFAWASVYIMKLYK
ncbi:hypothetical protein V1512DRAFT_204806, partial [Lipomyces arxii]|uniref:uncharacterized protein n=1 Tax=Lipomyces arxii TaxID=56418 RepID=UPI0034CD06FF